MASKSVCTLTVVVLLSGVLLPHQAAGQERPATGQRLNVLLCPMPVVGMSPGAAQRHPDALRGMLQDDDAVPIAGGPCFNPFVVQLVPPISRPGLLLQPFGEPPLHRDPFGLLDSLPPVFPLPSDSLPFLLLPRTLDP